jgi:hypothetical protein
MSVSARTGIGVERLCFYALCLASAAPLLLARHPPMVDLPQHAAQVATLRQLLFAADYPYRELFEVHWLNPYWGGYLPILALSSVLPIDVAIKLVLVLVAITLPLAVSRLTAHFRCEPALDWLALPIVYGFAFQWGFFNFLMGVPVVLVFLLWTFRYAAGPSRRAGFGLFVFGCVLFAVHMLIGAFGCGIAVVYVCCGARPWREKFVACVPFVASLPLAFVWILAQVAAGGQAVEPGSWGVSVWRPAQFVGLALGEPYGRGAIALGIVAAVLPFVIGCRITRDLPRLAVFAALCAWMLFGPDYILGNWSTFQRFSVFGVPLFLLVLTPPRTRSPLQLVGRFAVVVLALGLLANHARRFVVFEREARGYTEIRAHMQPGKRALMLMVKNKSDAYGGPQFLHHPAWYQAETNGIVDFSFAQFPLQVRYRPSANVAIPRGFEWEPRTFEWGKHEGWRYDYFVVRSPRDLAARLFASSDRTVRSIAESGDWRLYAAEGERR